ncbi:hypothetical protein WG66_007472, partial [Moniliophthora roreri]
CYLTIQVVRFLSKSPKFQNSVDHRPLPFFTKRWMSRNRSQHFPGLLRYLTTINLVFIYFSLHILLDKFHVPTLKRMQHIVNNDL